jgi:hypothetical protein
MWLILARKLSHIFGIVAGVSVGLALLLRLIAFMINPIK